MPNKWVDEWKTLSRILKMWGTILIIPEDWSLKTLWKVWLLRDFYFPVVHDPPIERLYWKMYRLSAVSGSSLSFTWIKCFPNKSEGQMCLISIWTWLGNLGWSLAFCSGSWRLGNTLLSILNAYLSVLGLYLPLHFLRTLLAELFCGIFFFQWEFQHMWIWESVWWWWWFLSSKWIFNLKSIKLTNTKQCSTPLASWNSKKFVFIVVALFLKWFKCNNFVWNSLYKSRMYIV